eukprot:gene17246-35627_t
MQARDGFRFAPDVKLRDADAARQPLDKGNADKQDTREATQRLLERVGLRVLLAKDGQDALEQMQEGRPDLMLVDIEMPRMDGFDLTRNVRGDERTRDIPIIMISAEESYGPKAKEAGVDVLLGKPYADDVMLGHIARFLKEGRQDAA